MVTVVITDKKFLRFAIALFYFIFIVLLLIVGMSIYEYILGKEKLGANAEISLIAILTLIIIKREIQLTKYKMGKMPLKNPL